MFSRDRSYGLQPLLTALQQNISLYALVSLPLKKTTKLWLQMLRTFDGTLQGFVLIRSGFYLNVENISHLLWLCIVTLPLAEKTRATFSSNQKWNHNQSWLAGTCFSALFVSFVYQVRVLIGSLCCLCHLWLPRVVSLVLLSRSWIVLFRIGFWDASP